MGKKRLTTAGEVMEALGGVSEVARLTRRTYKAAFQWRYLPTFPANTYIVMTEALGQRGLSAPPSLWGMAEAEATCS